MSYSRNRNGFIKIYTNEDFSGVYKIVNVKTGQYYIGSSSNLLMRKYRHFRDLKKNRHHSFKLQNAYNKYGEKRFKFEIIKLCNIEKARDIEQKILDEDYENTYNISKFSEANDHISYHPNREEIVSKIRNAIVSRYKSMTKEELKKVYGMPGKLNPMYGRTHSDEVKSKLSIANRGNAYSKGRKMSNNQRKFLSFLASKRVGNKNSFYGKRHSEETKRIISLKNKGLKPPNMKPVIIDNTIYESLADASRSLGIPVATVLHRVRSSNPKFSNYRYTTER